MCQAKVSELNKYNAMPLQDVENYITRPSLPQDSKELEKEILVKSFTNTDVDYIISLDDGSSISRCMCPYMANSGLVCKYVFMVERLLGYAICLDFSGNGHSQANSTIFRLLGSIFHNRFLGQLNREKVRDCTADYSYGCKF